MKGKFRIVASHNAWEPAGSLTCQGLRPLDPHILPTKILTNYIRKEVTYYEITKGKSKKKQSNHHPNERS